MKDLILRKSTDNSLIGTLRCEMLSNTPAQFEPVEIKDATGKIVDYLQAGTQLIQKINYSWPTFLTKCTTDSIRVFASDSNGKNAILKGALGTTYAVVSATGSNETVLVATDVTAIFTANSSITMVNSDGSVAGVYNVASSTYGAPNTSIVLKQDIADIPVSSGKFLIKN